jgi:hypothetical protein
LGMSFIKP